MQEGQLRVLLECVDLKSVAIVGVLMSNAWCLQFTRKNGQQLLLDSHRSAMF